MTLVYLPPTGHVKTTGLNLRGADLRSEPLSRAKLIGADLRDCDLRGANLHGLLIGDEPPMLEGANLMDAWTDPMTFAVLRKSPGCDLTGLLVADGHVLMQVMDAAGDLVEKIHPLPVKADT